MASSLLVLGGARSGKSRFAVDCQPPRARVTFVATAMAFDDDMVQRIDRHRAERPGHWRTVEEPLELVPVLRDACVKTDAVVVDCLTVWVANLLLRGDADDHVLKQTDELVALLSLRSADVTLVSNEVGLGVHPSTEDGRRFRDLLGRVNQRIAAGVDRVVLMVAGLPLVVKDA
ncbi:MAG TPA: bifunctional adenosylcobinamide kinase/adenosylcobinamide-phosphate guanylyltransferase, partial [Methylomirabilota bacterium]|nr:bifunctional adenosylcobinamide kinase/adenosylcobinamide-phosphate guanylyltransferase [Methylomirabilota bacterium]